MPPKKVDPPKLIIYKIKTDNNTAPHISNGILTLTLCKPVIRKGANVGDYVLALLADGNEKISEIKHMFTERKKEARKKKDGSLDTIQEDERKFLENDKYWLAAYLFRVEEIVTMQDYESWCVDHNKSRICNEDNFSGDCQYFGPELAYKPGPHGPSEIIRNRSGKNSLISSHYAAWTSDRPYLLSSEERANLQLDDDELKVLGVGQTYINIRKDREQKITEDGMVACFRQAEELIREWQGAHRGSVASASASAASAASASASAPAGAGASVALAPRATLFSNKEFAELEAAFHGRGGRQTRKFRKVSGKSRRVRK